MAAEGAPQLDIVVWKVKAASAEESSDLARKVFDAAAQRNLHLALVQLPRYWFDGDAGAETVTCLRSVLMKPEHEAWLPRIWNELDAAAREVLGY